MIGGSKPNLFGGDANIVQLKLLKDYKLIGENSKNPFLKLINPAFRNKDGYIIYYSPTCPHCVNFAPTVSKLAKQLKGKMSVGTVDCTDTINKNNILGDFFSISGFPTIKFYDSSSQEYIDYSGGRNINDLLDFVCRVKNVCGPLKK